MKRLFCSTFVLFVLTVPIREQGDARISQPESVRLPDECSTPGRPKPEIKISLGDSPVLCGKAISLPKPSYPEEARVQKISGAVRVNIVIDENGKVIWAEAVDGHPLLRDAAVKAACQSRHSPIKISDRPVKAGSLITYNFLAE